MERIEDTSSCEKLQWIAEHHVASISVSSNISGYDQAKCFVSDGDEKGLVQSFVDYLSEMSDHSYALVSEQYASLVTCLDNLASEEQKHLESANYNSQKRPIAMLVKEFERWRKQLPVVGYNSSKYDVNAIRNVLFPVLLEANNSNADLHVIKKLNTYMCISTSQFKILDILNYLSPNTSYSEFLKCFQVPDAKSFFPYEWFTDLRKLKQPHLPLHDEFYSALKKSNISQEEYQDLKTIWRDQGMKTMRDFLIYYNNLDVQPFLEAIGKMSAYFHGRGLDIFKDGISLPGLALKDLFTNTDTFFSLFRQQDEDLHHTVREQVVGGPSIIFNRYHEKGKTFIRAHDSTNPKPCQHIVGLDANALYLWALMQDMPTQYYNRRRRENDFKLETSFPRERQAREWLSWVSHESNADIVHRHRNGKEIRIGPRSIPVDGFEKESGRIWQFHGCLTHGHSCSLTAGYEVNPLSGKPLDELRDTTSKTSAYLREQGFTVIEMYECQWAGMKKENADIRKFISELNKANAWSQTHRGATSEEEILSAIRNDSVFGLVECDIHVPNSKRHMFKEMPPIFKNTEVALDDIGPHMREFAERYSIMSKPRRMLIGSLFGKKILLITPLVKWYLEHGLVVSKIYQVVEYTPKACFHPAGERVSEGRRQGDSHSEKSMMGHIFKLIGNSYYGKVLTRRERHTTVKYFSETQSAKQLDHAINDSAFQQLTQLDEDVCEVIHSPSRVKLDLPLTIGFFVYNFAKLRMLSFYYDFMIRAFDRSDFEFCETDTDSGYFAFSSRDWKALMKPEFKQAYTEEMRKAHDLGADYKPDVNYHWFPRECCAEHIAYDKRTPGLFKLEWEGDGIIGLCSKTYYCFGDDAGDKYSSKGIQQRRNDLTKERYLAVLETQISGSGVNRGFRVRENRIATYEQARAGLSYFYPKRKVLSDGRCTEPLDI